MRVCGDRVGRNSAATLAVIYHPHRRPGDDPGRRFVRREVSGASHIDVTLTVTFGT